MADSQLDVTIKGHDELTPEFKSIESQVIRFVGFIASAISTIKIGTFPIQQAADFQRELANVTKTTNFTVSQMKELRDELAQLSLTTDTSAVDLAKIAAAAGQQGLGKEGVTGIRMFTESVARMASVLDLSAEESGRAIGKILNIFSLPLQQVEKVSSAINQVSNNSTARATELINVLKRLGDAGGALKFTESLALSATAVDLGATPEIAGTTLSKFITAMKVHNDQFAKLLGITTKELSQRAATDGFKLFVETMMKFQDVQLEDREKAVSKMLGGGRITNLFDKFLIDVLRNPSILTKNLDQASKGFETGQSSIKEQATVMATLVKQFEILKNSFKELGRQAGEDMLGPLTAYISQLRFALQTPQMRAFASAVIGSLSDLVGTIVSITKAFAGLNINWENFLKVLKVMAEIKLIRMFAGFAEGLPGISFILAKVAKSTQDTTAAAEAAGTTGERAAKKQVTAFQALRDQLALLKRDYLAVQDAATAQAAAAARKAAADAAQAAYNQSRQQQQPSLNRSQVAVKQQQVAVEAALVAQQTVKQTGGQDILNSAAAGELGVAQVQAAVRAKQEAAEVAHERAMADIQARYRGARAAAVKAARDAEFAAEDAHFNRVTAALRVAGEKQIANAKLTADAMLAATTARVKAEIEAEEAKVAAQRRLLGQSEIAARIAAQNAAQIARIQAQNAAGIIPSTPNPTGAVIAVPGRATAGAGAAAAAEGAAATTMATRLVGLGAAMQGLFSSIPRLLALIGTGLRFVLTSLGPVYLYFMLFTSLLDALGLTNKLPAFLTDLGKSLGFVSEKEREYAQAQKDAQQKRDKELEQVNDLIERYRQLKDAKGQISQEAQSKVEAQFKGSTSTNDVHEGLKQLNEMLSGANAEKKVAEETLAKSSNAEDQTKMHKAVDDAAAELARAKKALDDFKKNASGPIVFGDVDQEAVAMKLQTNILENNLKDRQKIYNDAVANAQTYGSNVAEGIKKSLPQLSQNVQAANAILSQLLTPLTSGILDRAAAFILPLKKDIEKLQAAANPDGTSPNAADPQQSAIAVAMKERDNAASAEEKKRASDRVKLLQDEVREKQRAIDLYIAELSKRLDDLGNNPAFGKIARASGQYVIAALQGDATTLSNLAAANLAPRTVPLTNNPSLVNPDIGIAKQGKRAFDAATNGESEARKLAKAQYELKKAQLQASFELQKQYNDNFLAEDQRMYDRGLLDLESYYTDKEQVDKINLQNEMTLLQQDIDNKLKERKTKEFKESDRVKIDAEIATLQGKKNVLEAKLTEIPAAALEALRKATKDFNESVLTEKLDIMKVLGVTDFRTQLDTGMSLATSQMEDKLNKFETQLKAKTPGIDRAFINAFKLNGVVKAVDDVLQTIANHFDVTTTTIGNTINRIAFAHDNGQLTDLQAQKLTNQARSEQAAAVREQIVQSENIRQAMIDKARDEAGATEAEKDMAEASIRSTDAFKKQQNEIDSLNQKYTELRTVADETASAINKSFGDALTNMFASFGNGTSGGWRKALATFGKSVSETITGSIAKNWSQNLMQSLGSTGTGGIGGFFSSLLGLNDSGVRDKEMLGRTKATAMYVQDINGDTAQGMADAIAGKNEGGIWGSLAKWINGGKGSSNTDAPAGNVDAALLGDGSDPASALNSKVDSIFSGLSDSLKTNLDGFGTDFMSSFSSLFSSLSGGFGQLFGSFSGGLMSMFSSAGGWLSGLFGGGESVGAIATALFHNGGVVGSGVPMSRSGVDPTIFAHAVRYHTGGIAGLQPDEVPSILKKGEEVLTKNDPRHRDHAGATQAGNTIHAPVNITVVTPDANSFRRSQDQISTKAGLAISRAIDRNT